MKRAALYVRVSSAGQVRDGYSLQFQEQILREFCAREGLAVAGVYRDGGQSGSTTQRRDLLRLIADARQQQFDAVLIFRVDRFSRDPVDLLALVRELEARQIKLRSVTEAVDAGDPAGELMLTILGAIGKFVRQNIIQNAMLGKIKRAEAGRYTGGRVPFGYAVDEGGRYVPDPQPWWNGQSAAAAVRLVFDLYVRAARRGSGCLSVARQLNRMGVPGPGGPWAHSSVYQILTNPCYAGDLAYNRRSHQLHKRARAHAPDAWVVTRDAHEPLVPRPDWEEVQGLLQANRAGGGRPAGEAGRDVLTGFLACGECGGALSPRRQKAGQPQSYYTCISRYSERRRREGTACRDFPWLRADELEQLVWGALLAAGTGAGRVRDVQERLADGAGPELAAAEAEAARLARRAGALAQQQMTLTTAFAEGKLPEHLWQGQIRRLETERAATAGQLAAEQARVQELRSQAPLAADPADVGRYISDTLAGCTTVAERREALGILVGARGIRVFRDGTVDLDIRIPLGCTDGCADPASASGPTRRAH